MLSLLKNTAQLLTKPIFTILFLILTLAVFIYHAQRYHFIFDDYYFIATTLKRGYLESVNFLYINENGRWFSNMLTAFVFGTLSYRAQLYWYFQLSQFILFILSVSFFFKSILEYLGSKKISLTQSLQIGTFFSCLFYWFYFDSRIEVWYWESSCLVHLVCFICIFLLYGIIFHSKISQILKIIAIIFLSLFIGGLSETFALGCMIISEYQIIRNRKEKKSFTWLHLTTVFFISISLGINYVCPATAIRIGYLPEPEIGEGVKNMFYTFYLQLKKIKHIPFKIAGVFLLWPLSLLITNYSGNTTFKKFNLNKFDYLIVALLILENTFFPAYSISQYTPDRVFAFNWLLGLFLLLNYLLKKKTFISS